MNVATFGNTVIINMLSMVSCEYSLVVPKHGECHLDIKLLHPGVQDRKLPFIAGVIHQVALLEA